MRQYFPKDELCFKIKHKVSYPKGAKRQSSDTLGIAALQPMTNIRCFWKNSSTNTYADHGISLLSTNEKLRRYWRAQIPALISVRVRFLKNLT